MLYNSLFKNELLSLFFVSSNHAKFTVYTNSATMLYNGLFKSHFIDELAEILVDELVVRHTLLF